MNRLMPVYSDQTGRKIVLDKTPQRIISLVPSQTELLYSLGLREEVIGITKFCVHPEEWFRSKPRIGGTKEIKMGLIHQLQPDLIIANKEENVKEQIEELANHYPVWISDVNDLDDACEMIEQIGSMNDRVSSSKEMVQEIKEGFAKLKTIHNKPKTCYLIWSNPYMTTGGDTFIHSMLEAAGFDNIYKSQQRYPEVTLEQLSTMNCQLLLLASEPFPFKEKHKEEIQQLLPNTKIILVDGEMFSWYGSRLLLVPGYFEELYGSLVNGQW
ncbi:MAG: helical backbone metal receptor [Chitinophagaceae bacterium]